MITRLTWRRGYRVEGEKGRFPRRHHSRRKPEGAVRRTDGCRMKAAKLHHPQNARISGRFLLELRLYDEARQRSRCIGDVLTEKASGGCWDRPELHRMLDQLRDGDTVVVWKLDRLSRSLKGVLHLVDRMTTTGAGFHSLTEAIDTTAAAGRMKMQMVGSFAEFERAMIRERTTTGLAQARAEGRIVGRRKKLDPKKPWEIAESILSGRKSGAENGETLRCQRTDSFTDNRRTPPEPGEPLCRPAMTSRG